MEQSQEILLGYAIIAITVTMVTIVLRVRLAINHTWTVKYSYLLASLIIYGLVSRLSNLLS